MNFKGAKTSTAKAFNIPSAAYITTMIRKDLEDAGMPYKNDAGEQLDFHALRHIFGTNKNTNHWQRDWL